MFVLRHPHGPGLSKGCFVRDMRKGADCFGRFTGKLSLAASFDTPKRARVFATSLGARLGPELEVVRVSYVVVWDVRGFTPDYSRDEAPLAFPYDHDWTKERVLAKRYTRAEAHALARLLRTRIDPGELGQRFKVVRLLKRVA